MMMSKGAPRGTLARTVLLVGVTWLKSWRKPRVIFPLFQNTRGKPLPPGIAKKLDGRLLGQLPRYDGYEWMQAGVDLILVAVATGVIYEVLNGAFD